MIYIVTTEQVTDMTDYEALHYSVDSSLVIIECDYTPEPFISQISFDDISDILETPQWKFD